MREFLPWGSQRRAGLILCLLLFSSRSYSSVSSFTFRRHQSPCATRSIMVPYGHIMAPFLLFATADSDDRTIKKMKPSKSKEHSKTGAAARSKPRSRSTTATFHNLSNNNILRPVLTHYDANRNSRTNQERLEESNIGCEHFGQCSGCTTPSHVGNVDIIQSAKLFFSSTSVRRKRRDVLEQDLDWSVEETDDDFYKVVVPSNVVGWRSQAKLAAAPKSSVWAVNDGCSFGLYRRQSHSVLSIPQCAVHHPSINKAVQVLEEATSKVGTSAYQEESREGCLRYVQFQVERSTGRVCLTLVWNAESLKETQPALSRLVKELTRVDPGLWHSMWCHCNDGVGNNIFSRNPRKWHRLSGPEFLREPLPVGNQGWLYFSPLTFRQGNLDGFDIIANDVARSVPKGSKVCELYAGVGILGLSSLAYHHNEDDDKDDDPSSLVWLRCSDENPSNPRCFHRAVDSLPPQVTGRDSNSPSTTSRRPRNEEEGMTLAELAAAMDSSGGKNNNNAAFKRRQQQQRRRGEKTSYMVASATTALLSGQVLGANVLIVDPPRKGLDDELLSELCKPYNPNQPYVESVTTLAMSDDKVNWCNDVQTLIYVSCGFDALAREVDRLLSSAGGWILVSATGYVLFPGSDHVETLLILKRE